MVEDCSRPSWNGCHVCVAKPGSRLDQSIEDGFEIESRSTDDFEHIGGRSLLLERLAQLDGSNCQRFAIGITLRCGDVDDLDDLFRLGDTWFAE